MRHDSRESVAGLKINFPGKLINDFSSALLSLSAEMINGNRRDKLASHLKAKNQSMEQLVVVISNRFESLLSRFLLPITCLSINF